MMDPAPPIMVQVPTQKGKRQRLCPQLRRQLRRQRQRLGLEDDDDDDDEDDDCPSCLPAMQLPLLSAEDSNLHHNNGVTSYSPSYCSPSRRTTRRARTLLEISSLRFIIRRLFVCWVWCACCFATVSSASQAPPPQLQGAHFRITAVEEPGFLDITDDDDGTITSDLYTNVSYAGYLLDMIHAIAQPHRANFTYELLPPSGFGAACVPQLLWNSSTSTSTSAPYAKDYRIQYNCGANDVVTDDDTTNVPRNYSTDMYLGMFYVTPARQLIHQFTIPFVPPFSGTLSMFGTATGIADFTDLVQHQRDGRLSVDQTCGPAGTALIDSVVQSFPGLQLRGIVGAEDDIYQAFTTGACRVYINDRPIAAQFVLRRSRQEQCHDQMGNPIGVIGDPMPFGLSHYAIGIRHDMNASVVNTISYWMNILMTCNPLDPNGPCPEGNFATFYEGRGGTGSECGYVLYPKGPESYKSTGAIAGIVLASVVVALIFYTLWHRYRLERQKRQYAKKSNLAMAQAKREQRFNEYLSHEIRNPLASALAALSFVSSKTSDTNIVPHPEHRALIKADVTVIDSSLQFVNQLLRNMLDLHRTENAGRSGIHSIKLTTVPTDVLRDILEPIATILFTRGAPVTIDTECPKNLFLQTDRIRLKQILLNLSNNAIKFVEKGFIRLRAEIVEGKEGSLDGRTVVFSVEDSGPGLPKEKRDNLFVKFQDSGDALNQGTGIGLCVCKNLSDLMGYQLSLDDNYDSGIPDCPGTRFKLETNQAPMDMDQILMSGHFHDSEELSSTCKEELPEHLSVLFVDDDMMLRKMFIRVVKLAAPTWKVREASNGETALCFVEEETFDLIFVDQYMSSFEKQLLGTETIQALRAKGVKSIICGLSANDVEEQFVSAGANAFMVKPFPCKIDALTTELTKILKSAPEQSLQN